jgi:hypothetical protein
VVGADVAGCRLSQVRALTGAAKVDLVGHSQGGLLPRVYIKDDGGAASVHHFVAIAPDTLPVTISGLVTIAEMIPGPPELISWGCPACGEQISPSFFSALNAGARHVAQMIANALAPASAAPVICSSGFGL